MKIDRIILFYPMYIFDILAIVNVRENMIFVQFENYDINTTTTIVSPLLFCQLITLNSRTFTW